ncbi:MAG TPA: sugar porter family MFS transporter [Paludibacter sp.]|nr:sugar porter family MFS transporter [Paludibacter sp.]
MSSSNKRLIIGSSLTAALGGLLFGFDTAVISGTIPFITKYFQLSHAMLGWAVSSALIGCIIGSVSIGKPGDIYGRKFMLKILALLFLISAIGTAASNTLTQFVIFRLIGGLAIGGASVLSPLYISEISPAKLRGRLVSIGQLAIVSGILISFFSNYFLINTGEDNWRWMFLAGAVPALAFFILLFFISPSPRWLVMVGKTEQAKEVLNRLNRDENIKELLDEIVQSINNDVVHTEFMVLFRKPYLKVVLIGIVVGALGALTGINTLMYYAPTIFQSVGFSSDSALLQTVMMGATNLIFTVIGMSLIDKFGRKFLLELGAIGMSLFLFLIALNVMFGLMGPYALLVCIMGYQAMFASTMGVVMWVLLAEMFPNNIRARASSIGSFTNWVFNAAISFFFPVVIGFFGTSGEGNKTGLGIVFTLYSVVTLISFFFYRKYLVETKGKTLEQIGKLVLNK